MWVIAALTFVSGVVSATRMAETLPARARATRHADSDLLMTMRPNSIGPRRTPRRSARAGPGLAPSSVVSPTAPASSARWDSRSLERSGVLVSPSAPPCTRSTRGTENSFQNIRSATLGKGHECQSFSTRGRGKAIVECCERDPFASLALQVQAAGELHSVARA